MIVAENHPLLVEKVRSIGQQIGHTPLFPIVNLINNRGVKIFAKLEWSQFGGSVKARPAYEIIKDAIFNGQLTPDHRLIDASSGNTAIAYASIGASLQIPITICLPENASPERKKMLKALGAEIIYTSPFGTTDEAQEKAREIAANYPEKYFYADQYNNDRNWKAHYHSTAVEILEQTDHRITHFIAGLGTTGTFTGTSRRLKKEIPSVRTVALQPDEALHGLEGWKHLETAKVPGIYDSREADEHWTINTYDAIGLIPEVSRKEGLLISPSAAANLLGALELANQIDEGIIVTVFPDNAEKYGDVINTLF